MKKRIISLFLAILTVLSLAAPAMAADPDGWVNKGSRQYYYVDGVMQKDFQTIDGKIYFFNRADGHMMKNGWLTVDGERYYLANDGHVIKGGWKDVGGKRYYLDGTDGHMLKDCWVLAKGRYYRLAKDGHMLKNGWITADGERYYLAKDGHRMSGGWIPYKNNKYYLYKDGTMAHDTYVGGHYVGSDGARTTPPASGSGGQSGSAGSTGSSGGQSGNSGYSSNTTVYVSRNGKIHLRSNCSGMKNYTTMTLGQADSRGYKRCDKCF